MSAPVLTFFSHKGGVGKTSLIYHLAWMFADLGKRVLTVDLDPQANLTAAFLDEDRIDQLWNTAKPGSTIFEAVRPLMGVGDFLDPDLQKMSGNLYLLPGDVALSTFEDVLSREWSASMDETNLYHPMRILSSFWQITRQAADQVDAQVVLVDIGPNLGAINRSALLAADFVAIPMGADLFSLQGLNNLGPTLKSWKTGWGKRLENWTNSSEYSEYPDFSLPTGRMQPIGYLCQPPGIRLDRPVQAYDKWVQQIPSRYRSAVLDEAPIEGMRQDTDPYCLAIVKHYRSLIPMGQERRKPIFDLTPADGAIGSHANAVTDARKDFKQLATRIADEIGLCLRSGEVGSLEEV